VGAAIAAGSQAEKGICALLVIEPKNKNNNNKKKLPLLENKSQLKQPLQKKNKKDKRKNTSPTRFLNTVTNPDSNLEELE